MHPTVKTSCFSNPTLPSTDKLKLKTELPSGWDIERVQRILEQFEPQHHKVFNSRRHAANNEVKQNMIKVPEELVPAVLEMIEKYKAA